MSLTQLINYNDQNNFSFDSNKVEFVGGNARLKIVDAAPANFTQDFTSSVGFTYNASYAEFSGSVVRQKDLRPTGATFLAKFNTDKNGTWGSGDLTGTLGGSAAYNGGTQRVDIIGANSYLSYNNAGGKIPADARIFTIRFKFIPNYSGNPASNVMLFETYGPSGNQSKIKIYQDTASAIRAVYYNASGALIVSGIGYSSKSFVAGTEYIMEIDFDFVTGAQRIFFDGVQQGITNYINTMGPISSFSFGDATSTGRCSIDDIILFNIVKHTSNHAGELPYTYPDNVYEGSKVVLPAFTYSLLGDLQALQASTIVDTNAPKYTISNGVNEYWFNGANWVVSAGTYAEANFYNVFSLNLPIFVPPTLTNTIIIGIYFQTSNTTQMSTDNLIIPYIGQTYDVSDSEIVWASEILADGLDQFLETSTKPVNTEIKYIMVFANQDYYFNGANWTTSNGTYAQSNTAAEIETNKNTFSVLIAAGGRLKLKAILHTTDGQNTPLLTTDQIDYNFYVEPPAENPQCIVYIFAEDLLNTVDFNAQGAVFYVKNSGYIKEGERIILPFQFQTNFTSFGYAELPVAQTAISGKKIQFWVEYTNLQGDAKKVSFPGVVVPAQASANLYDLI